MVPLWRANRTQAEAQTGSRSGIKRTARLSAAAKAPRPSQHPDFKNSVKGPLAVVVVRSFKDLVKQLGKTEVQIALKTRLRRRISSKTTQPLRIANGPNSAIRLAKAPSRKDSVCWMSTVSTQRIPRQAGKARRCCWLLNLSSESPAPEIVKRWDRKDPKAICRRRT
jgi:hypothetical protein